MTSQIKLKISHKIFEFVNYIKYNIDFQSFNTIKILLRTNIKAKLGDAKLKLIH